LKGKSQQNHYIEFNGTSAKKGIERQLARGMGFDGVSEAL